MTAATRKLYVVKGMRFSKVISLDTVSLLLIVKVPLVRANAYLTISPCLALHGGFDQCTTNVSEVNSSIVMSFGGADGSKIHVNID